MWLDKPYEFTKRFILRVNRLNGTKAWLNTGKNTLNKVARLVSAKKVGRALAIDEILDLEMNFSTIEIAYSLYCSRNSNSVPYGAIHTTYQIIHKSAPLDLGGRLYEQLMLNLMKIKENSNVHPFNFGGLLLCVFFYFTR